MAWDSRSNSVMIGSDSIVMLLLSGGCGSGGSLLGMLIVALLLLMMHPSWLAVRCVLLLMREYMRSLEHLVLSECSQREDSRAVEISWSFGRCDLCRTRYLTVLRAVYLLNTGDRR